MVHGVEGVVWMRVCVSGWMMSPTQMCVGEAGVENPPSAAALASAIGSYNCPARRLRCEAGRTGVLTT